MYHKPRVSIIIAAYNAVDTLAETLTSIIGQTYDNYEVILVDDGSTDNTLELALSFQLSFPHCIIIKQANQGPASARNHALVYATGDLVAILDADDVLLPGYLEKLVNILHVTKADAVYPNAWFIGEVPNDYEGQTFMDKLPSRDPVRLVDVFARRTNIFIATLLKKDVVMSVGGFDEHQSTAADLALWIKLLARGNIFTFTREPLVLYRRRSDSLSRQEQLTLVEVIKLYRSWSIQKLNKEESLEVHHRLSFYRGKLAVVKGKQALKAGDNKLAHKHFLEAHALLGGRKLYWVKHASRFFPGALKPFA